MTPRPPLSSRRRRRRPFSSRALLRLARRQRARAPPPPRPQDVLDQERVRVAFNHALNMMNCAADGQPLPPMATSAGAMGGGPQAAAPQAAGGGRWGAAAAAAAADLSLRDLVARFAADAGLEFLPRPGRLHDGAPVYAFGGVSVVLDNSSSMVRAQLKDGRWAPVSLDKLLQEARARGGGG